MLIPVPIQTIPTKTEDRPNLPVPVKVFTEGQSSFGRAEFSAYQHLLDNPELVSLEVFDKGSLMMRSSKTSDKLADLLKIPVEYRKYKTNINYIAGRVLSAIRPVILIQSKGLVVGKHVLVYGREAGIISNITKDGHIRISNKNGSFNPTAIDPV